MATFPRTPLPDRLQDGLERLASLNRVEQWRTASAQGLNPTQLMLLNLLGRPGFDDLRVQDIARELGLSQPTVTDSLIALERKGLVARMSDAQDRRAVRNRLTEQGRAALLSLRGGLTLTGKALSGLSPREQGDLLGLLIKMIRALLDDGQMPMQRMCVTCRHFRPQASPGTDTPHFCDFVSAPFGSQDLRIDCGEHDAAPPDRLAATWRNFIAAAPGSGHPTQQEKIE